MANKVAKRPVDSTGSLTARKKIMNAFSKAL